LTKHPGIFGTAEICAESLSSYRVTVVCGSELRLVPIRWLRLKSADRGAPRKNEEFSNCEFKLGRW